MRFEDIAPHLNKIATLYLKNNKRKVGWLFTESLDRMPSDPVAEIYFVNIQKGRKLIKSIDDIDLNALEPVSECIPVNEIVRIRSSK